MALEQYGTFRRGRVCTLPAADASITDLVIPLRLPDALTAYLNPQGEGNALAFTLNDNTTVIPHQVIRRDWPVIRDAVATWYSRPEAYFSGTHTHFALLDQLGRVYDHAIEKTTGTITSTLLHTFTTGVGNGKDDHNNGAYELVAAGRLACAYNSHGGTELYCRVMATPNDPTSWGAEITIDATNQTSYALPILLDNGDFVVFYRRQSTYARGYQLSSNITAGSPTFGSYVALFRSPDNASRTSSLPRPYMHVIKAPDGKVWFLLSDGNPSEVTKTVGGHMFNNLYVVYYDPATGNVHQPDGEAMAGGSFASPPAGGFDTWAMARVYDGFNEGDGVNYWNWDIQVYQYSPGVYYPVIVGVKYVGAPNDYTEHVFVYAKYTPSGWVKVDLTSAGLNGYGEPIGDVAVQPYYAGGIVIDPQRPTGRLFLSHPHPTGAQGFDVHELLSADSGATWSVARTMNSARTGERRCFRPLVPRNNADGDIELGWFEGHYRDFQATFAGSGVVLEPRKYACGLQTFPRKNDGYVAYLKLNRDTNPQEVHVYYDRPGDTSDESDEATVWAGFVLYARDIHVNCWDTGVIPDMDGATQFTFLMIARYGAADYRGAVQITWASCWENNTRAAFLMREQTTTGNNWALLFNSATAGGTTVGSVALSTSPSVNTWYSLGIRWDKDQSSGNMLPILNGTALTPVAATAAAMASTNSSSNLWLGRSPHNSSDNDFIGDHGGVFIAPTRKSVEWVEEFTESNPYDAAWNYATFGNESSFVVPGGMGGNAGVVYGILGIL